MWRPTEFDRGVFHVRFLNGPTEAIDQTRREPRHQRPWCWVLSIHPETGAQHTMPTWDIRRHYLDLECECEPELDAAGLTVHKSFDGRERYEQGGAPRN